MGERLARLLLLACTVLGVAALHTIGHAAIGVVDHHDRSTVSVPLTLAATVVPVAPGTDDGCTGDGCDHQAVLPGATRDSSRWWDVCLGVLSVLAVAVLAAASLHLRGLLRPTAGARRRPPPSPAGSRLGLDLKIVTVLRT